MISKSAVVILRSFNSKNDAHTYKELTRCLSDINKADTTIRVLLSKGYLSVNRISSNFNRIAFDLDDLFQITDLGLSQLEVADAESMYKKWNDDAVSQTMLYTKISALAACIAALIGLASLLLMLRQ